MRSPIRLYIFGFGLISPADVSAVLSSRSCAQRQRTVAAQRVECPVTEVLSMDACTAPSTRLAVYSTTQQLRFDTAVANTDDILHVARA